MSWDELHPGEKLRISYDNLIRFLQDLSAQYYKSMKHLYKMSQKTFYRELEENFSWIKYIFPNFFIESSKIVYMTVDKALLPIKSSLRTYQNYNEYLKRSPWSNVNTFIDEADSTYERVADSYVEQERLNSVDIIEALRKIVSYADNVEDKELIGVIDKELNGWIRKVLTKNINMAPKTEADGDNQKTKKQNILFVSKDNDDVIHISDDKGSKPYLLLKTNENQAVKNIELVYLNNSEDDTKYSDNDNKNPSTLSLENFIESSLKIFGLFAKLAAKNIQEEKPQNADALNLSAEDLISIHLDSECQIGRSSTNDSLYKFLTHLVYKSMDGKLENIYKESEGDMHEQSFYEKGFHIVLAESSPLYGSDIITLSSLNKNNTSEMFLLDMCKYSMVFPISATADIVSPARKNYDFLYITKKLKENSNKHFVTGQFSLDFPNEIKKAYETRYSNYSEMDGPIETAVKEINNEDILKICKMLGVNKNLCKRDLIENLGYHSTIDLSLLCAIKDFLNDPYNGVGLFLTNKGIEEKSYVDSVIKKIENDLTPHNENTQYTTNNYQELSTKIIKDYINLICQSKEMFHDLKKGLKMKDVAIFNINSDNFDAEMKRLDNACRNHKKAIILSTYNTISAGTNIQFNVEDEVVSGLKLIRSSEISGVNIKESVVDIGFFHLGRVAFLTNLDKTIQGSCAGKHAPSLNTVRLRANEELFRLKEIFDVSDHDFEEYVVSLNLGKRLSLYASAAPFIDKIKAYELMRILTQALGRGDRGGMKTARATITVDQGMAEQIRNLRNDESVYKNTVYKYNPLVKALIEKVPDKTMPVAEKTRLVGTINNAADFVQIITENLIPSIRGKEKDSEEAHELIKVYNQIRNEWALGKETWTRLNKNNKQASKNYISERIEDFSVNNLNFGKRVDPFYAVFNKNNTRYFDNPSVVTYEKSVNIGEDMIKINCGKPDPIYSLFKNEILINDEDTQQMYTIENMQKEISELAKSAANFVTNKPPAIAINLTKGAFAEEVFCIVCKYYDVYTEDVASDIFELADKYIPSSETYVDIKNYSAITEKEVSDDQLSDKIKQILEKGYNIDKYVFINLLNESKSRVVKYNGLNVEYTLDGESFNKTIKIVEIPGLFDLSQKTGKLMLNTKALQLLE